MTEVESRALGVRWKDMPRWDIKSARAAVFRLAHPHFRPFGEFIEDATETVRPADMPDHEWPVYGVSNVEGVFHSHNQKGADFNSTYKRIRKDWFFHNPTRANVGSFGRVPDVPVDAITSPEYQVWRIKEGLLPEYVEILIKTPFFLKLVQHHRVGAVKERLFFENLAEIPVPVLSLSEQRTVVRQWQQALIDVHRFRSDAMRMEKEIESEFLAAIGIVVPEARRMRKTMAMNWSEINRWSVQFNQLKSVGLLPEDGKCDVVPLGDCLIGTGNGFSIPQTIRETSCKILKLNALNGGRIDKRQSKYVDVDDATRNRFHIKKNDLLICRSIGSFEQIAKCALVDEDDEYMIFPDIIIRARMNEMIIPEYARDIVQSRLGRAWFQQNARTSVGMWKIGGKDIHNFPIPLPSIDVQRTITNNSSVKRREVDNLMGLSSAAFNKAVLTIQDLIFGVGGA